MTNKTKLIKSMAGLIAMIIGLTYGCRLQDVRELELNIPDMLNPECAEIIVGQLTRTQGVLAETIRVDLPQRRIMLEYDSMILAIKNIEFVVADAGFAVNNIPANEAARQELPAVCRGEPEPAG